MDSSAELDSDELSSIETPKVFSKFDITDTKKELALQNIRKEPLSQDNKTFKKNLMLETLM